MEPRSYGSSSCRRFFLSGLLIAGLTVGVLPGAAMAKGKPQPPPPPPTSGTATCSVTPNPLAPGSQYTISGSGYKPNEALQEWIAGSSQTTILFVGADSGGNLSGASAWANQAGSYTVTVKDASSGAALARCGFTVS